MEHKIISVIKITSKIILLSLMLVLTISLILGTFNLFITLLRSIVMEKPSYMLDVKDLYPIFNLILIIVVGIEMLKSMSYILDHNNIPVRSIMLIALVALGNKVITLDIKNVGMNIMIGLGVLIISLSVSFFLIKDSRDVK